jgi:hypothetical protein
VGGIVIKQQPFYWEIKDVITQFVSAIDGCVINRYTNEREVKEKISAKYVFAQKDRVMYDIVNKSQNLTLPIIAINATDVQRTSERVFNKHDSFYYNNAQFNTPGSITRHRTPVPVRISLEMSILAGYQLDLEQIASNFIAYFNPYIILSTKVPTDIGPSYDLEVRTKATWNGTLNIATPVDLTYAEKFRRIGDTSFVLDSWIYPEHVEDVKPIYFIDANFYAISQKIVDTSAYYYLSGETYTLSTYPAGVQGKDTVSLSGTPSVTNIFYSTSSVNIELDSGIVFTGDNTRKLTIYGYNFNRLDYIILSAADTSLYGPLTSLQSTYYGPVSGTILNVDDYSVLSNNIVDINISRFSLSGENFSLIFYNQAGWDTTSNQTTMFWAESGFFYD